MTAVSSKKLLEDLNFCVIDLETTGGNHQHDKIIEIGLVKITSMQIRETKSFLINPEIPIPEFIQRLTNISVADVADAPKIEDVIEEIVEFMGDSILIAHNTSFDIPFFNSVLNRLGRKPLENRNLCTNLMTKYLIPNLMNSNLNYMSRIFGIEHNKAHRALDDAYATAELLIKYLHIFIDKNISKINHLYYPRNKYELDRRDIKKDDLSEKEIFVLLSSVSTPFVITIKGENGTILFSLPCEKFAKEKDFLQKQLHDEEWLNLTVRLYGTFIEAVINFNGFFNKLAPQRRSDVIDFLSKQHLGRAKEKELDDHSFIITTHLIPDQYIIFPIKSLHPNSSLVFRYPSHKKKLVQYIQSKSSKIKKNQFKKVFVHPLLEEFLQALLKQMDQHYSFNHKSVKNDPNAFFEGFNHFLAKNQNSNKYPAEYI